MSDDDTIQFNTKNLDALTKTLKENMGKVRVGILGGKSSRSTPGQTNATIGAAHEYGTEHLPQRSFLRVPIAEHLQSKLDDSGAFDKEALEHVVKEKSLIPWLQRIGIVAVNIVTEAFDTGGFGKWPKWKNGYTNNTGQVLVDTQQLRNSITSDVTE